MSNTQPNPRIVQALRVNTPETTTKTVLLDADVNTALNALKAEAGMSKQELTNKLLRFVLFSDAAAEALAKEAA